MSKKPMFNLNKLKQEKKEDSIYTESMSIQVNDNLKIGKEGIKSNEEKVDINEYKFLKHIGGGSLNEGVDIVEDTKKNKYVLKSIRVDQSKLKEIHSEVKLLYGCDHPNIIRMKNAIVDKGAIKLILEFMDCGSLENVVEFVSKHVGPIEEKYISKITEGALKGLIYLHETRQAAHRDLKPANILVNSRGEVKLADFGSSGQNVEKLLTTFTGSEAFMSPERLKGEKYGFVSDIWSLGLIVAYMLFGKFPFSLKENSQTADNTFGLIKIISKPDFINFSSMNASPELVDFVKQCLLVDMSKRPTASMLMQHEFILKYQTN